MTSEAASPTHATVQLRPMTARHLPAVVAIERRVSTRPWTPTMFARELEEPDKRRYLVALGPRQPRRRLNAAPMCGFGGVHARPDAAHITTLAVDPDHQRHGLGRRLLDALLRAAVELGSSEATLEVRAGNDAAQRLYERAGFAVAGVRSAYYAEPTEDAVVMWRRLPAEGRR